MGRVTGYVIERGMSTLAHRAVEVVAVALLPATPSKANRKTGPALTISYLPVAEIPYEAAHVSGLDEAVCGDCKLRPLSPSPAKDGCYLTKVHGISQVWRRFVAGGYPDADDAAWERMLSAGFVRFGGWGDPACFPPGHVEKFADIEKQAGYTHQHRRPFAQHLKRWMMASCETLAEREEAKDRGWRSYRIRIPGAPLLRGEIDCPYPRVQCNRCGACDGAKVGRRKPDVSIEAHGPVHKIRAITKFQEEVA